MHVLIAVFIAGLMIGRTPEYLGKKIQAWEATWAVVAILVPNILILGGSAIACRVPAGLSSLGNQGPHGLSEIFYAYASSANNNGSAFAGLSANTNFYNLTLGSAMFLGRFAVALAALAIAGSFAAKKTVQASPGHAADARDDVHLRVAGGHCDCRRPHIFSRTLPGANRRTRVDAGQSRFLEDQS